MFWGCNIQKECRARTSHSSKDFRELGEFWDKDYLVYARSSSATGPCERRKKHRISRQFSTLQVWRQTSVSQSRYPIKIRWLIMASAKCAHPETGHTSRKAINGILESKSVDPSAAFGSTPLCPVFSHTLIHPKGNGQWAHSMCSSRTTVRFPSMVNHLMEQRDQKADRKGHTPRNRQSNTVLAVCCG